MTDSSDPGPKPGLGVGTIIGECFSLTFGNIWALIAVLIPPVLLMVVFAGLLLGFGLLATDGDFEGAIRAMTDDPVQAIVLVVVYVLIVIFLSSFMFAAAIKVYFDAKTTGQVSIADAYRIGMVRTIQMFVVYVLVAIVVSVAVGVPGALFVLIDLPLLIILLLPLLLYLSAVFLPSGAAVVIENMWFSALGRSIDLTKGYRWPIVGLLLLLYLIIFGIALVSAPLTALFTFAGSIGSIFGLIVNIIINFMTYSLLIAMITLVYARLREIKEGTELTSLADVFD